MRESNSILKNAALLFLLVVTLGCSSQKPSSSTADLNSARAPAAVGSFPAWAYDPGPDPTTDMGKELIDLYASIPSFPALSDAVVGDQEFRPAFGPIPWRMVQKPNSVKILFIGQDGTHIAEAAGRPATAGFGGRAQDLAKYFGVSSSAAFINAYAYTIKKQYGLGNSPFVMSKDGKSFLNFTTFVPTPFWLMSNDLESPLVQWRNQLIEWIIRNNKDSLKMIVLFGGAARDAAATFVESKGGKVGSRFDEEALSNIRVPEVDDTRTVQNKVAAVLKSKSGEDLWEKVLGRPVSYQDKKEVDLKAAQKALTDAFAGGNGKEWMEQMVFSESGIEKSGLIHPAQLGGYDTDKKMEIKGKNTISLKGLKISDDFTIKNEVVMVQLPHPTYLSIMKMEKGPEAVADAVAKDLDGLRPYAEAGWKIDADPGLTNEFAKGSRYTYGRAGMGPEYYDFGAPNSRMVDVSTAERDGPQVIVFGTGYENARFDKRKLSAMQKSKPSRFPSKDEFWTMRARGPKARYVFDSGPGEKFAKIMKENLPSDLIKKYEENGDFAHYRGTFKNPKVLILADPYGYDDLITARALTGSRGQYLQGLMEDLGVEDQYLVLKTAPFLKISGRDSEWAEVIKKTKEYREKLIEAVLAEGTPKLILTDGSFAAEEMTRLVDSASEIPVIHLERDEREPSVGIVESAGAIQATGAFRGFTLSGKMKDIPRSHMTFYARLWEGTSGDRVIGSTDAASAGRAFAEVAPTWAVRQKPTLTAEEIAGAKKLNQKLKAAGLRMGGEEITTFVERISN